MVRIAVRDGVPELAPLYLGLVGLAEAVPGVLFTFVAGALADRVDRRRLMLLTQSGMAATGAALAFIVWVGAESLPAVLVADAIISAAFTFDNPSRQSLVPRLVPRAVLPSAIGLQSASWNMAAIIGPALAGVLFVPIGIPGLLAGYAVAGLVFVAALLRLPSIAPMASGTSRPLLASVADGLRYIRRDPVLVWTIALGGTVFAMAGPTAALMPAVTGEARSSGISLLSLMLAALGIGALLGSAVTMNAGHIGRLGRAQTLFAMLNGGALILFAFAPTLPLALGCLVLAGAGSVAAGGMGNNIVQATAADTYRGRVISVWGFLFLALLPTGQFVLGTLGSVLGIRATFIVAGVVVLTAGIYARSRVRPLSEWQAAATPRTVLTG